MSRTKLATLVFLFFFSCLTLATARDIPSVTNTTWEGEERTHLTVRKLGRVLFLGTSTLEIDPVNQFVYDGPDSLLTYVGNVTQTRRSLRFFVPSEDNLPALEEAIKAAVLELADLLDVELGAVTVSVDSSSIKAKGRVKTRRNNHSFIKQKFKVSFEVMSALGMSRGHIRVRSILPQTGVVLE